MSSSTSSRDGSRDRADSMLKHQHSFSDSGRASVPMWDSSDPDRAPPPLPLNPGVSSSPITKPNTSARIEEAAALITARARDSAPSSYVTNGPPGSPEKSLIKPQHRRMQSIQGGNVRGISDSLERRSPDKGLRTPKLSDYEEYRASRSPERSPTRSGSETPTPSGRLTPSHLNRPILGENTPPSATMLALQTMRNRQEAEAPLSNITNMSTGSTIRTSPTFDAISAQILSLTSIATNLQREMAQLSRRSRDNATDLISLKEATNSRDEDIRKSLRDLVTGLDTRFTTIDTKLLKGPGGTRSTPDLGLYIDDKAHNGSPGRKGFNLPRIPSPTSFSAAIDRGLTASPSLKPSDCAASVALLEKVLREMCTKDGQDQILSILESVKAQTESRAPTQKHRNDSVIDPLMMTKLEDILVLMKDIKENPSSRALVKTVGGGNGTIPSQIDLYFEQDSKSGPLAKVDRDSNLKSTDQDYRSSEAVNEEVMKMLKNVKQSLSQGGGLTNEVKALVRELRGEVLGMGREIARKLEQVETGTKSAEADAGAVGGDQLAQIIEDGIAELKEHMHQLVQESYQQSASSSRSIADTQEIVNAVQTALSQMPRITEPTSRDPAAEREELLAAVREAWEDCKPEIALEHFGLERDEILDTVKEGLKSYSHTQPPATSSGLTYDEVVEAMQKSLSDFQMPSIPVSNNLTREEIMETVRECLENFDFSVAGSTLSKSTETEITKDEVLETIKHGLSKQPPVTKEVEFNREDLFDAIRACLEGEHNPLGGMGEKVLDTMHDFLGTMKNEFQQYSAANGKDTEQVLDAMKDGLEELRADIESYVDRAADVTGKDEIIDTVKAGFQALQVDLEKGFAKQTNSRDNPNTPDLLDAMEKEFEHLRESITRTLARSDSSSDKEEILDAIRDISDERGSALSTNTDDVLRVVKEELQHMRTTLAGSLVRAGTPIEREEIIDAIREGFESNRSPKKPESSESILSNTSELLDAFQEGVDGIRSDMQKLMDRPADINTSYDILDTLKAGIESIRSDIDRLHEKQNDLSETATARGREVVVHDEHLISTEIEGLKIMITQLRIKVEALDNMPMPQPTMPMETHIHKDDLEDIHSAIKEVHRSVNQVRSAQELPTSGTTASKDDTDAIETLLRNVRAKLDEFNTANLETVAQSSHLDSIEDLLKDIKLEVEHSASQTEERSVPKEDFAIVELLVKEVAAGVEEIQSKLKNMNGEDAGVTRADIQLLETLCLDTKTQIEELILPDPATLPTKDDVNSIKDSIKAFQEQIEAENELTAQAFEARKVEHGGLATKIEEVKDVLGDLRDELVGKLDGSEEGIVELSKVLGMHHESMSTYATAESLSQLSDLVNKEFERHMEHHVTTKLHTEDRDTVLLSKYEDVSSDLKSKIDDKFNELMLKYDDAQMSNESKLRGLEDRDRIHLDSVTGTKALLEDLKILIDTLGTTVTESCDRQSDDSKTVFGRVDDITAKINDLHASNAQDHGLTREELGRTLNTTVRIEGCLVEHQPAVMASLREIIGLVGQHYEHSQRQTESFSRATEDIMTGVNGIPSSIPPLLPALPPPAPAVIREVPAQKEYDDSQVHDKLNNLISHAAVAKEAFASIETHHKTTQESLANMEKLDRVHDQVMATASEISAMVTAQTRMMFEQHESKAAEAVEAAIALEKRTAQKEKVEADIISMNQEKEALMKSMATLKAEQEELHNQTKRLTREVAKLETALTIRQEEMKEMDSRAEALERRILEGVMNHARSTQFSKPAKRSRISPAERDRQMSLKRVPSSASTVMTTKNSNPEGGSTIGSAVGMALKGRAPLGSTANSTLSSRSSGAERRILSTSYVTGNRGRESPAGRALMLAPPPNPTGGLISLKRSHSVKSNPSSYFGGRKASWNGTSMNTMADKENNVSILDENEEDGSIGDEVSDAGTERRSSLGGTSLMYTDSMTYGTGSSLSTAGGRTVSYASSIAGAIGANTESIAEEDEEERQHQHENLVHEEATQEDESAQIMALLAPGSPLASASAPPPESFDHSSPKNPKSLALVNLDGAMDDHGPSVMSVPADEGDEWLSDLQPPPRLITTQHDLLTLKYAQPSDSGLGTEPPTADFDHMSSETHAYFEMTRRGESIL